MARLHCVMAYGVPPHFMCVFPMVIVSVLPHVEFGPNDAQFICKIGMKVITDFDDISLFNFNSKLMIIELIYIEHIYTFWNDNLHRKGIQ